MNFLELKQMLDEDVNRPDKAHRYARWIASALRKCQQDVSWNCMRQTKDITMVSGTTKVSLPDNFKELTPERTPVHIKYENSFMPVTVTTFEAMASAQAGRERIIVQPGATRRDALPVYISYEAPMATPFLNVFDDPSSTITFHISYFGFLPDLAADGDQNYLTVNYEEMVESKLKTVAFKAINDPIASDFELAYIKSRDEAAGDDAVRRYNGRTLQMGG